MQRQSYKIGNCTIRSSHEYLNVPRNNFFNSLRHDIYDDIKLLSKLSGKPMSKVLDCIISETLNNRQALDSAIDKLKKY